MYALGDRRPVLEGDQHFLAPDATIIGSVRIADGVSVWFQAVIRGDNDCISIGARSNIQDGAILHTDPGIPLTIGRGVTVGHRAMLHGCTVGDHSLIGIGSTVLNHASLGEETLLAANALVTEDKTFPAGVLLMGAPAKVVRELEEEERAMLRNAADVYVAQGARYREHLASIKA